MTKRKSTTIATVISTILLLVLFVGSLTFLLKETDNLTTNPGSLYVEVDGQRITSNKDDQAIAYGTEYRFDVGYALDINSQKKEYTVTILPNVTDKTSFDFKVGNDLYAYEGINDLNQGFNVKIYDDYFTIKATSDLPDMIKGIFPNATITGVPDTINTEISYYKMIISSKDKSQSITITFHLFGNVILDKYEVIF